MASSSSSCVDWKYDVFLSFRGEDTRKTFVGHLYEALIQKAMNAYQDSKDLEKGNKILELLKVIEDSRISIVVLSRNYASSKWCLRELAKIMDCRDNKKQIVVPIFYEVDPTDVRNIKGTFAQAFAKHEANSQLAKEDLESWRLALTRVADLSGWDSRKYEDDRELIKKVVGDTLSKWIHTSSIKANKGLVGMDSHITEMNAKLCLEVNDVRVVGIWGMGGLGKTTIAEAVYGEIARDFEHSCFVRNVKYKREAEVQEELLLSLLKEKGQGIDLQRGREMIMKRLSTRKVLVVLDDVKNFSQLKELLGEPHALGKGSRIIVTTRDQQSPKEVNETYHPECLNRKNSRELLVKHAFRTDQPSEDYIGLFNQAIEYAHGLPLALKVLGASLYDKNIDEWKDLLEKIKIISDRKIMDVLRISFEGLDSLEQKLFLDIACIFKGWKQDYVTEVLHDFHPHIGLKNLVNRALVTVSKDGTLDMHDLLQELGREIVRQEYLGGPPKEPGQRSRLWSFKDVDQVLTGNMATDAIECLMLKFPYKYNTYCINVGAFAKMTKLRVLIIDANREQDATGELEFRSHELRLLQWIGCPLQSLPNTFIPKNLVILDMSDSHIQQLWEGTMPLQNLKEIWLSRCESLVKIPDLTKAIHLKKLYLDCCSSLLELHSSIFALQELEYFTLKWCEQLRILPSSLRMKSLETLHLSGCSNLVKFPEISDVMSELQELDLSWTAIKELPESINNLTGLRVLNLSYCTELTALSSSIHLSSLRKLDLSCCSNLVKFPEISGIMEELPELCLDETAIEGLPSSIDMLKGIKKLSMRNCKSLECLPDSIRHLVKLTHLDLSGCTKFRTLSGSIHISSLKFLYLHGCSNFEKFPDISGTMKNLGWLELNDTSVKGLPSSIHLLEGLKILDMRNCKSLECLPDSISHLVKLIHLDLSGCIQLLSLPDTVWNIPELEFLSLSECTQLRTLSGSIHMSSLKFLILHGCSNFEKFPDISGTMKNLSVLDLDGTAVKGLPSSIHLLEGLKQLIMRNCKSLECLPDSIRHLVKLTHLDLSGCIQLKTLSSLPDTVWNLPELESLSLSECTQLRTLSGSIHMSSLKYFNLRGCSNLEKFPEISGTMKYLSELDLNGTAVKGLPSSIHLLEGLKKLIMRNCKSLECLPDSICNLAQLKHLELDGCNRLKSIPELSSINRIDAHCCTALETVSTPKIDCTDLDFRFSNCRQLVQTNLFTNIVETRFLDQNFHLRSLSCNMCFPGSEIPNWFSHQSRASSITVQLPPNWFDEMFLGFAICAVSCFNETDPNYSPHVVARCYCTFQGNHGEHNFNFHLQDWGFTSDRSLESDHLFMAYVPWYERYEFSSDEEGEPVNKRYYTEATFKIVVESTCNSRSERHCMTSYGVRFFHGSYDHVELRAPSFPDQLEIRKSETEWEAESSSETAGGRGMCQTLEILPEPQTGIKEKFEIMFAEAQGEGCPVSGSVCCLSLSGCNMSMRGREADREGDRVTMDSSRVDVWELGSRSGLVVPNSQFEGQEEREMMGVEESLPAKGLLGLLCSCFLPAWKEKVNYGVEREK